jgi:hypothetical protein
MSVQPVNRDTRSTGFSIRQVAVEQIILARGLAICKEQSSLHRMEVSLLPIRVRTPKVGEIWLIDQQFGYWSFAATVQTVDQFAAGAGTGPSGAGLPTFCMGGLLVTKTGTGRIYNPTSRILTIGMVRASVEIPAIGYPIITDLRLDGVSLGLPLTLVAGAYTVTQSCSVAWPVDSYLSVDVTQIGSIYPGDTLTFSVTAE